MMDSTSSFKLIGHNRELAVFSTFLAVAVLLYYEYNRRQREWINKKASAQPFHVLVIGGGVSGIAAGFYMKQKNINFTIIEKNDEVGGTWYKCRFPGVRFDSLHVQTLYSFAPLLCDPMCDGRDFFKYLIEVAKKFGIYEHIRLNETVQKVNFNTTTKMWEVKTNTDLYKVNYVINANGYYDSENPNIPVNFQNPDYQGRLVHSFKMDQEKENFTGSDVIVIGSGATAATMIPHIAKQAKSVTMIQRSPSYALQSDYGQYVGYPTMVKLYQMGITWPWKVYRVLMCIILHKAVMFMVHVLPASWFQKMHRSQLQKYSKLDPEFIEKNFSPKYNFGEQRPLVSIGFIEALQTVNLITATTKGLGRDGVELEDGRTIKADTIILATGFNLEYFKFKVSIDNKEVDMYDQILRRDMWFEGIPNFINMVLFARLDSKNYTCFTPLVEHAVDFITDVIQNMRAQKLKTVVIKPFSPDQRPTEKYFPLSSGYFKRNKAKCFKSDPEEAAGLGAARNIIFGYTYEDSDFIYE